MKKSLISVFIIIAFFMNVLSLSFLKDKVCDIIKYSSIEQILFNIQNPTDTLSKLLDSTSSNKSTKQSDSKENKNIKVVDYILPIVSITENLNLSSKCLGMVSCNLLSHNVLKDTIEYPLKIPFLRCIYLLLLMTLLFSVLPRSISINYNIKNIEKACIV